MMISFYTHITLDVVTNARKLPQQGKHAVANEYPPVR